MKKRKTINVDGIAWFERHLRRNMVSEVKVVTSKYNLVLHLDIHALTSLAAELASCVKEIEGHVERAKAPFREIDEPEDD